MHEKQRSMKKTSLCKLNLVLQNAKTKYFLTAGGIETGPLLLELSEIQILKRNLEPIKFK